MVTTNDATYMIVSPRGATVLDLHFVSLLNILVVVDGYNAYNMFNIRQRCWTHLLRDAEKYAIKHRAAIYTVTLGYNYVQAHQRQIIYQLCRMS